MKSPFFTTGGTVAYLMPKPVNAKLAEFKKRGQEVWNEISAADAPAAIKPSLDRDETISIIRQALKKRSGKAWSITGGKGTAWGWITITAPPARRDVFGRISDTDCAELGSLLGLDSVHPQGVQIAASSAHRREYVERAEGRQPQEIAKPYWD